MFDKPRRLIGWIFLAAIPLAALNVADKAVRRPGTSDPVMLRLEGVGAAEAKEMRVFRVGLRDSSGKIEPRGNPPVWTVDRGWLTRLEIEASEDLWERVSGATLEIGARSWRFDRSELLSQWKNVPVPANGAGEVVAGGIHRRRSPPEVRAETSRLARFQPYMNWQGDGVLAARLLRTAAPGIISLTLLAALFLFLPRRLPLIVRQSRVALRSALRRSPVEDQPPATHAVYWNLSGLLAVGAAFAFLEWQFPYYFVQDDVLILELPGILVGCRSVWEGRLPEWNPYTGLGSPLMSEGLYSLTYPPLYVSYAIARHGLGDEYATMEVFALMHLLAGFWLCKRLCMRVGCGDAAGMLASLSFVLSGPVLILGRCWHMFIPLAVWIPAIALSLESLRTGRVGWRWLGLSAICLAMPVHVGFPQLAVACIGLFCLLTLSLLITRGIEWSSGFQAVAAVLMGLALSAPLLLCQKEHGRHVQRSAMSDLSAGTNMAAAFLPEPFVVTNRHPWLIGPDMPHLYFFGGLLAWCWAAGLLLTLGGGFAAWARGPRLWWSAGVASFLLALGDTPGLWNAVGVLPVLSMIARVPIRMLPFFVFGAVVSGGWIFDRLWARLPRFWARGALMLTALGLLAYHMTQVDRAITYLLFRPYPQIAGTHIAQLQPPNTTPARRVCPFEDRRSPRAAHGMSLADSMAAVYAIYSTEVYDPVAESSPSYQSAVKRMAAEKLPALQAYGVGWLLIDRNEIKASAIRESGPQEPAPHEAIVRLPWQTVVISELDETLGKYLGRTVGNAIPCGSFELYNIQDSSPLVFRTDEATVGLPFQAHTAGVDVDLAGIGGKLVVNFLRLDWMTCAVDGTPVSCNTDEWGRIVVEVPRGAKQLAIRYQPPWKRGGLIGTVFGIAAVGIFLVARHHSTRLVLLSRSPTGRDECNDV